MALIFVFLISAFRLVGCAKKTSKKGNNDTKAEYDTTGLPLTKASALKLMQGDWHLVMEDGRINEHTYRNDIKDNKYLLFGSVEKIKNGDTSFYAEIYREATNVNYDVKIKKLYISRIFEGTTITTEIQFISKDKVIMSDYVYAPTTYIRVK